MSHFITVVILPKKYKKIFRFGEKDKPAVVKRWHGIAERAVAEILAPFDENKSVDPHEEGCYCVGSIARHESEKEAEKQLKIDWEDLRKRYWAIPDDKRPVWQKFAPVKKFGKLQKKLEREHLLNGKPDTTCEDCKGTGKRTTSYNPNSKWDWWQIGGRWTGQYSDYDPAKDPNNIEVCDLCGGTGERHDKIVDGKCNACGGKGKKIKWPTQFEPIADDILPVESILSQIEQDENKSPFAIVTPDKEWLENGDMGWFGFVSNGKEEEVWAKETKGVFERFKEHIAVVVDCHI